MSSDVDAPDPPLAADADVAKALGTSTKKETVNTALREVLENRRRALALTRLRAAPDEGAFDLELFEDKGNYRR